MIESYPFGHNVEMKKLGRDTLGGRIREVRSRADLSQEAFARRLLGRLKTSDPKATLSRGAIGNWELGSDKPELKHLEAIDNEFEVGLNWLVKNIGCPPWDEPGHEDAGDPRLHGVVSTEHSYEPTMPGGMPDIDVSVGLGPGGLPLPVKTAKGGIAYAAEAVRGEIVLPPYLVGEFTRADPSRIHWFRTRGDSMSGTIEAGDRVGADTTDTAIAGGGVFVIRDRDGEVQVKRLKKLSGKDKHLIEVRSDNPKQGSYKANPEEIAILGRVVARISRVG